MYLETIEDFQNLISITIINMFIILRNNMPSELITYLLFSCWLWEERIMYSSGTLIFYSLVGCGRNESCIVVVHSSSGQRLIRHEWEASLPDVGLSKTLRFKAQRQIKEVNT